jgi:hypothetical protein
MGHSACTEPMIGSGPLYSLDPKDHAEREQETPAYRLDDDMDPDQRPSGLGRVHLERVVVTRVTRIEGRHLD